MPVLKTYTAPVGASPISGGRRAEGSDLAPDFSGAAAGIKKAADTYLDHQEENESRQALIKSSEIRAKYARKLDEAQLSGGDLGRLKEEMASELAKVGETFQTKKGADSLSLYTSNTELMFDEQANRINVQRASTQARIDGANFLNSEAAILRSNPAYLGIAEKNIEAFGATLTRVPTHLREALVQEWKQSTNMAAALSSARLDPEGTRKRLDGGEWNLTPEQREAAIGKTDQEVNAKRAEERYQRQIEKEERQERNEVASDVYVKQIFGGKANRRSILDDPDLNRTTREHLLLLMEQRAKAAAGEEKRSDPGTLRDLFLRINAPDGDPRKIFTGDAIFNATKENLLNVKDATFLFGQVAGQRDENNRTLGQRLGAMSTIVQGAISRDPTLTAQPARVAEIQNDYNARAIELISKLRGKNEDPAQVFDPNSKNYIGSREFVQESINTERARRVKEAEAQMPKVKTYEDAEKVKDGEPFVDPNGVTRTMTKALRNALKPKAAPAPGQTWTGNISDVTAP